MHAAVALHAEQATWGPLHYRKPLSRCTESTGPHGTRGSKGAPSSAGTVAGSYSSRACEEGSGRSALRGPSPKNSERRCSRSRSRTSPGRRRSTTSSALGPVCTWSTTAKRACRERVVGGGSRHAATACVQHWPVNHALVSNPAGLQGWSKQREWLQTFQVRKQLSHDCGDTAAVRGHLHRPQTLPTFAEGESPAPLPVLGTPVSRHPAPQAVPRPARKGAPAQASERARAGADGTPG